MGPFKNGGIERSSIVFRIEQEQKRPDGRLAVRMRAVWDSNQDVGQFTRAYAALIDAQYPNAQLVQVGSPEGKSSKKLQWSDQKNRIMMYVDGRSVEIIEMEL